MSTELWSPIDSDLLFPSPITDQNEYFLADGKTSNQYPDGGDQPVKLTPDGMNIQGQDPAAFRGTQGLHEIISPEMLSLQLVSDGVSNEVVDLEDEFTDDEFYPGISVSQGQIH